LLLSELLGFSLLLLLLLRLQLSLHRNLVLFLGSFKLLALLLLFVILLNVLDNLEALKPWLPCCSGSVLTITVASSSATGLNGGFRRQAFIPGKHVLFLFGSVVLVGCKLGNGPLAHLWLGRLVGVVGVRVLAKLRNDVLGIFGRIEVQGCRGGQQNLDLSSVYVSGV